MSDRSVSTDTFRKWMYVAGGMVIIFIIYLLYSNTYGSNFVYNQTASTVPSVTIIKTSNTVDDIDTQYASSGVYLGAELLDIDKTLALNLGLASSNGVLINSVVSDSPADNAGLERGDVIISVDGKDIATIADLKAVLADEKPGDRIRIAYIRKGVTKSTYLVLGEVPIAAQSSTSSKDAEDWGISMVTLTQAIRTAYIIPDNINGVVVLSVIPGGIADQAGLKTGDVITGVNGVPISDISSLFTAILKDNDDIALLDVYSAGKYRYVPIDSTSIKSAGTNSSLSSQSDLLGSLHSFIDNGILGLEEKDQAIVELINNSTEQDFAWCLAIVQWILWTGLAGLFIAFLIFSSVRQYPDGNKKMIKIADKIRSGTFVFIKEEYRLIFKVMLVVFVILTFFMGLYTALAFALGALCSLAAGYIGVNSTTSANVRTCQGAKDGGISKALAISFKGGAVMGLSVAALGVVGISIVCLLTDGSPLVLSYVIVGFALGASMVALFARVGGGIYTKSADIGADLVGKLEEDIPEDDPRNPGVIADLVGDCVGDTAGMGADLFESYVGSVIAATTIGMTMLGGSVGTMVLPLLLAGIGVIATVAGIFGIRFFKKFDPQKQLRYATYVAGVIFLKGAYIASVMIFGSINYFWVIFAGIICGILMGLESEYFTSGSPVKRIAKSAESGSANTIITGFAVGLKSSILPILTICATIYIAYRIGGLYGIALSAVGMSGTIGIIMSIDSFGPIVDNAGGIAELSGAGKEIRDITDELDSVGNTTAAIGKGFAIGSAAMTATSFFAAYLHAAGLMQLDVTSLVTGLGLFMGAVVPFAIAALTMESVGKVSNLMVNEIRRQFKSIKGLIEGKAEPDSDKCIDIAATGALNELVIPGMVAITLPLIVGMVMGKQALGGFILGGTVTGIILGLVMINSGGAWDNAKKYIEKGNHGGKGSASHKASITGDTVGDPFKDTAGPAMNIIIKLMAVVALIFAHFYR
ncbi:MAG: sodium-translocating pyrophosphatase [Candidatus Omnitrophica bacterium]|nr:sodium-translocating pyrophosphatase [Candidatus Omnitrophota bacterium]